MIDPGPDRGRISIDVCSQKVACSQAVTDQSHLMPKVDINEVVGNQSKKKAGRTQDAGETKPEVPCPELRGC